MGKLCASIVLGVMEMDTIRNNGNNNEDVLMYFEIPYYWKGVFRRRCLYVTVFMIILYNFIWFISAIIVLLNNIALKLIQTLPLLGNIAFIVFYLYLRYRSMIYDRKVGPMKIWIKNDRYIFQGNYTYENSFHGVYHVNILIDDDAAKLIAYIYDPDINGISGWIYCIMRDNIEKGKYIYYLEKYWIPSAKLMVERIKALNPNVKIYWTDYRKKKQKETV